jgi:hypothetical protein
MADPKRARDASDPADAGARTSFFRSSGDAEPRAGAAYALAFEDGVEAFLDQWSQRHFMTSVRLHDAERVCAGDDERLHVLEDLGVVQGGLLELHELASASPEAQALLRDDEVVRNGVTALYGWVDDLVDAALLGRVARRRPGFIDEGDEDALVAILDALGRVHPGLDPFVRGQETAREGEIAEKVSICFRQIGAAVVRVTGRASTLPPLSIR